MTRSTVNTTAPRLYVESPLHPAAPVPASREQTHYLRTVLRRTAGDSVRLFNGVDGEFLGRIATLEKSGATFIADEMTRAQTPESGPWLMFALLKRDATDLVVRQAVELGAARIEPVITERTITTRVNDDRFRLIAIEAAEQSERLTIPEIAPLTRLPVALAAWPVDRRLFAAIEREAAPGLRSENTGGTGLLIGPEGGFTAHERELLRRAGFVTPVSLGPRILRAETAAAAGLALLLRGG